MKYLAHISDDKKREQSIYDHLQGTAELAAKFADAFSTGEWGYGCGSIHDIGKYTREFQKRLKGEYPIVDHATAAAVELIKSKCFAPAYCVAGHHSGLPDGGSSADTQERATLNGRLSKNLNDYQAYHAEVKIPSFPKPSIKPIGTSGFSMAFFLRMIFSCLVDADFLDTEAFMKNCKRESGGRNSMETLFIRLYHHVEPWLSNHRKDTINGHRSEILRNCLAKGKGKQGLYSLTVPTGGGKTISSLAFALQQAREHHLQRIIYVIPYTSIIEQNAEVFYDILGRENVLEDHYNVTYDNPNEFEMKHLAAENWDIPVVVTTNVQFFESLFANRPSRCRKLHNISKSVIIFDEAQMLPVNLLQPCIRAISELVYNYQSTAVICTATQPALQRLFPKEIPCAEICEGVEEHYKFFRRTQPETIGEMTSEDLIDSLKREHQALCILNNRKRVQKIYNSMKGEGVYHLSTFMYPNHRRRVLKEMKPRLLDGEKCLVISTSLVEAGVDLDFQTVYREIAGIDSIIQAAGRCNREGKKDVNACKTYVFQFPSDKEYPIPNMLKQPMAVAEQVMREENDIASLSAIENYFRSLYYLKGDSLDQKKIVDAFEKANLRSLPFATVANEFHLIEQNTKTILIAREDEAKQLVKELRCGGRSRELIRKTGHYSVNIYEKDFENMNAAGLLEILDEEIALLRDNQLYSEETGLQIKTSRGDGVFFDSL